MTLELNRLPKHSVWDNGIASLGHETPDAAVHVSTEKNGLVRELYPRLGFTPLDSDATGRTPWRLDLAPYSLNTPLLKILENAYAAN